MTEEMIERPVLLPEYPQLAGAVGAALYAMDQKETAEMPENEDSETEII
jgi:activator of 2-hydroxyglutaryl-CoA dehydratase